MSLFSSKSNNPVFNGLDKDLASRESSNAFVDSRTEVFTVKGVAVKIVAAMLFIGALTVFMAANPSVMLFFANMYLPLLIIVAIGGIGFVTLGMKNPAKANIAFIGYTIVEGVLIAFLSALFIEYAFTALLLTLCVVALTAVIYARNPEIVTDKFKAVIGVSILAIAGFYLLSFIVSLISGGSLISYYSPLSIGISIVVTFIVAARLLIDFQEIDNYRKANVEKNFEWLAALGTLVTIIWLYLEILKLLIKLSGRRR